MLSLFRPHPEIPNHYELETDYYLLTTDRNREQFKWSRIIRDNYIDGYGFLTHGGIERLNFRCFHVPPSHPSPIPVDQDTVVEQFQKIIIEGTETILHYYDKGNVISIVTGIDPGMFQRLSEQYQVHYYENH